MYVGLPLSTIWDAERRGGGFLNADLLLWVQHAHNTRHDILVIDTSIATSGSRHLATDLTIGGELLRMLERADWSCSKVIMRCLTFAGSLPDLESFRRFCYRPHFQHGDRP